MPFLLLSQLSFGHEANVVVLAAARRLQSTINSLIDHSLELLLNLQQLLPDLGVTVSLPAFLIWLSHKLHWWCLVIVSLFCALLA